MKAMILAAGYGTRLGILSEQRPKPMLPVGNIPLISHAIALLKRAGISEIAINTHHRGDHLTRYLGDGSSHDVTIHWSHEEGEILGTGGGVKKIRDFIGKEALVVMNGKMVTTCDLGAVIRFHEQRGALGTMVLRPDPNASKWGSIGAASDGRLASILGKGPSGDDVGSAPTMFTGISVIDPAFIDTLPEGPSCMVRQGWKPLFQQGHPLYGYVMDETEYWHEHSTPERYFEGNRNLFRHDLLTRLPAAFTEHTIPADVSLTPEAMTLTGANCQFGEGVTLRNMVILGDDVTIHDGVTLSDCVVWPRSTIDASHENAIITPRGVLPISSDAGEGFTGPALKKQ